MHKDMFKITCSTVLYFISLWASFWSLGGGPRESGLQVYLACPLQLFFCGPNFVLSGRRAHDIHVLLEGGSSDEGFLLGSVGLRGGVPGSPWGLFLLGTPTIDAACLSSNGIVHHILLPL